MQVSKHLHTILTDRSVWCSILRDTCIKEELFQPSFPMDEMTLRELQHASLAPSRWRQRISSAIIQTDLETFYASLDLPSDHIKQPLMLPDTFPIPGGRYLISVFHCPHIGIHDLGAGERQPPEKWTSVYVAGEGHIRPVSFAVAPLEESVVRVVMWNTLYDHWLYVSLPHSIQAFLS